VKKQRWIWNLLRAALTGVALWVVVVVCSVVEVESLDGVPVVGA